MTTDTRPTEAGPNLSDAPRIDELPIAPRIYPDFKGRGLPAAMTLGELWASSSSRHESRANDAHYNDLMGEEERTRAQWCLNCPAPDCTGSAGRLKPRKRG